MGAQTLFLLTVAVCLFHGLVPTPLFAIVAAAAPLWWPEIVRPTQTLVIYGTSLIVSTATLLIAGVPAALVERSRRAAAPDTAAMWVWLAGAVSITILGIASRG